MSDATQQIDLTKFCDPGKDGRYALDKPWVAGGWLNATDGKVAVRVPAAGQPDTPAVEKRVPNIASVLPPVDGDWQPWPNVERCESCESTGVVECENCCGVGQCNGCRCKGDHECGICDGTGTILCHKCRDVGGFDFRFGATELARHYAHLIACLPNVEYLPTAKSKDAIRFRFAGGEGAVMGFQD